MRIPTNYCISYETEVETNIGKISLRELKEALEKDIYVEVKTPVGYKKVNKFFDNGKKKKCKVKLSSGEEIVCSPHHRFLVKSDEEEIKFKRLKNIDLERDYLIEENDNVSKKEIREALQKSK